MFSLIHGHFDCPIQHCGILYRRNPYSNKNDQFHSHLKMTGETIWIWNIFIAGSQSPLFPMNNMQGDIHIWFSTGMPRYVKVANAHCHQTFKRTIWTKIPTTISSTKVIVEYMRFNWLNIKYHNIKSNSEQSWYLTHTFDHFLFTSKSLKQERALTKNIMISMAITIQINEKKSISKQLSGSNLTSRSMHIPLGFHAYVLRHARRTAESDDNLRD